MKRLAILSSLLGWFLCLSFAQAQTINTALVQLQNHIAGTATLTAAQIKTQGDVIQSNVAKLGTDATVMALGFEVVADYETKFGALFVSSATKNGFDRNAAGFELAQAIFDLMQGLLDKAYTPANLVSHDAILNGAKFKSSAYFPGAATPPADATSSRTVTINASQPVAWGAPVMYETNAARRPTGCYLAPGSVSLVTVPTALVNKGFVVRVGAHSWDLAAKGTLKRLDRISLDYPITSAVTRIANPLGGGIYIEVPYKASAGIVSVTITNSVRSPFFSATSFHKTTLSEWQTIERTQPGPWADFESDKFMMQVPRSWIYAFPDPVTLMADWDSAMDAVSDLMGLPQVRSKTVMYAQPDVLYRTTVNAPGYPMSNDPYSPATVVTGNKDHYLLNGPKSSPWTVLHELGHSQLFTKFTGEQESAVHMLYIAVHNQKFGVTLDNAMGQSIGNDNNQSINLKHSALSWILSDKFRAGKIMADTDMKYQHRGHGKYVEIAKLFGWQALGDFWHSVHLDYINGKDYPENSDPTDSRILRMSKAAGADLRPLIHLWGVHPLNAGTLKTSLANAGLKPSSLIYDRLVYYRDSVPMTLAEFRTHYWAMKGGPWDDVFYEDMYVNYTPSIGQAAVDAVQDIIDLYFPNGDPGAPTISTVANQTVNKGAATAALAFTVGDSATAVASLTVTGTSSNPALVPTANIVFGGTGASRTVTVTPVSSQFGTSTITLTVNDGSFSTSTSFTLTVINTADTLVATGSVWKYLDTGTNPGPDWFRNSFADTAWASGPAMLGFGDLNGQIPATLVNATSSRITTYFRRSFQVADPKLYGDLTLRIMRDDGAVVYLNGVEVGRSNMPAAPAVIADTTQALIGVPAAEENAFFSSTIDARFLRAGTNVLAVEVHQLGTASSDLGFDLSLSASPAAPATLIASGSTWKYLDTGVAPGTDWTAKTFADTAWASGPARLGYGDTQATVVDDGGDSANRFTTTWFRHTFTVADATLFNALRLEIQRDDGVVVFLNGTELLRDNLPSGPVTPSTFATLAIGTTAETAWNSFIVPAGALTTGSNTLAIELHQASLNSTDLGLDVRLYGLRQTSYSFADWQAALFGSDKTNAIQAGDLADPDNDGVVSFLEYAFGTNPLGTRDLLPTTKIVAGRLALPFTRNALATDLVLTVQAADSPSGPWTDLARSYGGNFFEPVISGTVISETTGATTHQVEVQDIYPQNDSAHPQRFLRLVTVKP